MRRTLEVLAFAFVLAIVAPACSESGSSGGGGYPPPTDPPPAACLPVISACTAPADCCGTCFYGYCMPSVKGGKCATSGDCQDPYTCVGGVCATAACRQDLDVCTADTQCCAGHCRPNGTCGANRPPVVDLGADRSVDRNVLVFLGSAGVQDPDGDPITRAWTLAPPAGSAAALSSATGVAPSFLPDRLGAYTATVTVSDGQLSASDTVILTAVNTAPVARAGINRLAPRNTLVQLDASTSSDLNGDPLSYAWTLSGPAGFTATLSSASDPKPTFTPDLLGDYVATVTVGDGFATASASVTVTATNTPPSPQATGVGAVNAGESATLSAATSTDENGDPLTFAWTLTAPVGSASTLTSTTGLTTSFTTDVEGDYALELAASDGIDTRTTRRTVHAYPHVAKLAHDVVAAAYSRATDRLITVSTTPANALWILDPVTEVETRVDLAGGPPLSVGVSADGLVAVVGRNGGITQVDLVTATVVKDCVTQWSDGTTIYNYDAASVAVGAPKTTGSGGNQRTYRNAYATPGFVANRGSYTMRLDLDSCAQSADWTLGSYFQGISALRPGHDEFFVMDYGNDTFYVYGLSATTGVFATRTAASAKYTYDAFWFFADGARFLTQTGNVYDANFVTLTYSSYFPMLGSLGDLAVGYYQLTQHADYSATRQDVSIVPKNDYGQTDADTVLKRFYASTGGYPPNGLDTALPYVVVDGGLYQGHGRWVFYRSDGSTRYAVIRTPPGAALTLFAVASMGP